MGELSLFASPPPSSTDGAWSVLEVTMRARSLVEQGFGGLWVRGEITDFKAYRSGHWYFTLRDAQAQVRCVMWRLDNQRIRTPPKDGMQVFVAARPTVWEEKGELRLTVKNLLPSEAGGPRQLQLERAKAALQRDGLLDPGRKRPLPPYPSRIAVVTSPEGAALRDIISVIGRRWPLVDLVLVPTRVQGEGAEEEICEALARVNRITALDLVVVGRGGGSQEDLRAFNSEAVARAVAAVRVPTISAVGHETDMSLTDLVADLRAPTPSAAAEAAVPDRHAVVDTLAGVARHLAQGLSRRTEVVAERAMRMSDRLHAAMQGTVERAAARLALVSGRLDALSPLRVLGRGYAVARDDAGAVLKRTAQFTEGLAFRLTVIDGDVRATARGSN
ncbi:MAG: exodeoxyribonuclease VII large subunit [Gemmatimonadetes bacterium]|nr:exodeoxyribonuclease VII large subunit [Gemmatimonadota bacterium]